MVPYTGQKRDTCQSYYHGPNFWRINAPSAVQRTLSPPRLSRSHLVLTATISVLHKRTRPRNARDIRSFRDDPHSPQFPFQIRLPTQAIIGVYCLLLSSPQVRFDVGQLVDTPPLQLFIISNFTKHSKDSFQRYPIFPSTLRIDGVFLGTVSRVFDYADAPPELCRRLQSETRCITSSYFFNSHFSRSISG
jgi:hypothetical protein